MCNRRGHCDLCEGGGHRVFYPRTTAVLRAKRGRTAGVRHRRSRWGDELSGTHQRTGRRRPRRVSNRFAAIHADLPGKQHRRGGAGRGASGLGVLQLHHRPAAARTIRDRIDGKVRRGARNPTDGHSHHHRRSTCPSVGKQPSAPVLFAATSRRTTPRSGAGRLRVCDRGPAGTDERSVNLRSGEPVPAPNERRTPTLRRHRFDPSTSVSHGD
jgi:hypothetical protein